MFAADGSLQDEHICIWGNIYEDKEYYDEVVCKLFSKVFNKEVKSHEKKSNSVYGFYICDKKIIQIFKDFGFSRNKTYTVSVPKQVMESNDNEIIAAFIRGFADCDGCLNFVKRYEKSYIKFKRDFHTCPRIYIGSVSGRVIEDISHLLTKLKLNHSKHLSKKSKSNEKDAHIVAIRGKERLNAWNKLVGFNNHAKITKYVIWKKFGFCPSYTSMEQRKLIISGKLNPLSFYPTDRSVTGPTGFEPATSSLLPVKPDRRFA